MAEETSENQQSNGAQQAQQRTSMRFSYEGVPLNYANLALVMGMPEEVVLNFGLNAAPPTAEREVNVQINNRVIMSYPSAKRLALTLGNVISRYEEAHGVIPLPSQQAAPGTQEAQ